MLTTCPTRLTSLFCLFKPLGESIDYRVGGVGALWQNLKRWPTTGAAVRLAAVRAAGAVRVHRLAAVTELMLRPGHPAAAACRRLPHEACGRAAGIVTEGAETSLLRCQRSRQASSLARRTAVPQTLTACSPAVLTACRRLKTCARCCCDERPVARVQNPLLVRATVNAAPLPQVCPPRVRTPLALLVMQVWTCTRCTMHA